ncbi:TPA: DUF3265 domain-containing protein [Vibrio vulnificus]|nr:DUF3265 domain-containing protein [Vibrio vulnificus]MCG6278147.1 DUF3265 domain-containing protein [Vibrio vulnificus]HAS8174107.1 DUF3265 domain-containing protein [Vibrio vulnificus]HAS8448178.1 DUF3265 domain-containing protein [Vibrio vulnificus]HAS8457189.1 DUF3265 domain-containing protein [Vibrio vulnificus]HDY7727028.1 DUF3265 domain-containing protein [Vibrio vulnificus]
MKVPCFAAVHNKAFKRDSCRVAFLLCGEFCGESILRKVSLCGIHPLTQRYTLSETITWS